MFIHTQPINYFVIKCRENNRYMQVRAWLTCDFMAVHINNAVGHTIKAGYYN